MGKSPRRWGAWVDVEAFTRPTGGGAITTTVCVRESTKWTFEYSEPWPVERESP